MRLIAAAVAALALTAQARAHWLERRCGALEDWPLGKATALFVADAGAFSGTGEDIWYSSNCNDCKSLDTSLTLCEGNVNYGTIMGQKVVIAGTGIGPLASTTCVLDFMNNCGIYIKEVIYSGTSGWSPSVGGVISNGTCDKGLPNPKIKPTRIGDVCVAFNSLNWDCRQASFNETAGGYPDQCKVPKESTTIDESFLYGKCLWNNFTQGHIDLADSIMGAAKSIGASSFPKRSNSTLHHETEWWSLQNEALNGSFVTPTAADIPTVWDYKTCMEADSQFFWSGAPWDIITRQYISQVLRPAVPAVNPNATEQDVIVVSAMEAIGLGAALTNYAKLPDGRARPPVPFVYVRGNSDYVHQPVIYNQTAGIWQQYGNVEDDFANGYAYAIASYSNVVLSYLKSTCLSSGGGNCTYTITYPPKA
ncbi:hypothetical protein M427DRAFT_129820 [Gonapodya prolifera JEL478]|uniref:Purine nucleoside permease n=1 Tax=Gonapodya prolifera (strain JEL478) TaxID=1344416 RepID=A0A139AZA8_GONPJ|nr:hypothetical protein M427DRAFT_129820 [Gonapodya prolifera JEL478]|eukprot:KXS22044.1 hypothetical protein M427DRAFT_129820 [Gonapodya prolifera JEL478]